MCSILTGRERSAVGHHFGLASLSYRASPKDCPVCVCVCVCVSALMCAFKVKLTNLYSFFSLYSIVSNQHFS